MTADQVRALRLEREQGATARDLAARYGVAVISIYDIVNRKTWRDVS